MKIHWKEVAVLYPGEGGHGVEIISGCDEQGPVVAFVHGYEWLHGSPDELTVSTIASTDTWTVVDRDRMRQTVEQLLLSGLLKHGPIGSDLFAWFNA